MALRKILIATGLAASLLAAAACSSNTTASTTTSPSSPATTTTSASIVLNASLLTSTAFAPNPVIVKQGTSVTWTNNDSIAHTSSSNTGLWSSGTIAPGASFAFTFNQTGTFPYHCTIHPGMVGTVTVQ